MPRTILNLLVVWLPLESGTAAPEFSPVGPPDFPADCFGKAGPGPLSERHRKVARVYMLLAIPLTWLLFAVPDVGQIGIYLTRLFPFFGGGIAVNRGDFLRYGEAVWSLSGSGLSPLQSLAGAGFGSGSGLLQWERRCACCCSGWQFITYPFP